MTPGELELTGFSMGRDTYPTTLVVLSPQGDTVSLSVTSESMVEVVRDVDLVSNTRPGRMRDSEDHVTVVMDSPKKDPP